MRSLHISFWVKVAQLCRLFSTPWTVAGRAPLSMEFSRQEYWSGLLFPSLGDLPNPGIKPRSTTLQANSLPSEPPGKPHYFLKQHVNLQLYRKKCLIKKQTWRRKWQPTPVFLPGKIHAQRSLAGWSPWDYMNEHVCTKVEGDGLVAINW